MCVAQRHMFALGMTITSKVKGSTISVDNIIETEELYRRSLQKAKQVYIFCRSHVEFGFELNYYFYLKKKKNI